MNRVVCFKNNLGNLHIVGQVSDMRRATPSEIKLMPAYPLAEAARYLHAKPSTLHAWLHGQAYRVGQERRWSKAVLASVRSKGEPLSFLDLVEAHVLLSIRNGYGIPLKRFRTAMEYLREVGGDLHFLAHRDFYHDRRDLFVKLDDKLVSLSERGQLVDKEIIAEGLKQLVYGNDGYATRFFVMILRYSGPSFRRFDLTVREMFSSGVMSLIIILVAGMFVGMVLLRALLMQPIS